MSKNLFNSIQLQKPKSNTFDLSHDVKLSFNMGELIPIMVTECIPGDHFKIGCETLLRFAPLVSPVMHRMDVSVHYFFVPNRLVWIGTTGQPSNPAWAQFITQDADGQGGGTIPAFPYVVLTQAMYDANRLWDYMGIPRPDATNTEQINALPLAAYSLIYNEYYRDENLIPRVAYSMLNGLQNPTTYNAAHILQKRAWQHDYFTSALPFAQKGAAVSIPLGDIVLKPLGAGPGQTTSPGKFVAAATHANDISNPITNDNTGVFGISGASKYLVYDPLGTLTTQSTTINDLRRAFRLQEWLERQARGGTRYTEQMYAHFGVKSSDKRLQRPEYITGFKSPVVISEVLNTTGTEDSPQGTMAGHGVSVTNGKYGNYYCEEHGFIIGIMSVMPKTAYQQGIPKLYSKISDPFQYFWPEFANIGEQEVYNREVYAYQGAASAGIFGYVPRYAEYKFENSRVAGDFRTSLNFWHLGRIFASPPALNKTFIECVPDPRIFAITDPAVQKMYCHCLNKVSARRLMPKYGTPQF